MTEKICGNCSYWVRTEGNRNIKSLPISGKCNNTEKFVYEGAIKDDRPFPDDILLYWDYEQYSAGFLTGENFGCIHWEEKNERTPSNRE